MNIETSITIQCLIMFSKTIFLIFLPLCFSTEEVTFKNVTFLGYSFYTELFKITISSSNSLKEYLPRSAIDKIEFSEQHIPVLHENSLADLEDLDKLFIEYCQVTEIQPGALKKVPSLRRFSLKGNKLVVIEEGVFNNLDLRSLDLSLNSIIRIASGAFDDLPSILLIILADNKIGAWNPSWFKNTPLLTRISMQNNCIQILPQGVFKNLQGHKKLGKVDLPINIMLSYNQIEDIAPGAFNGLERINNLWLDNNRLEDFDENLLADIDVKGLRLNNNKIRCLKGDLGKILKPDRTYLDSNPLDCQCLDKIKAWATKNGKYVEVFFSEMNCTSQVIQKEDGIFGKTIERNSNQDNDIEIGRTQFSIN